MNATPRLASLCVILLLGNALQAQTSELPTAFEKAVPESIKDLQAIQKHVTALTKKLMPATVGLRIGNSSGSGVIIDKEGHVLTAGHVSGAPDRDVTIILQDGKKLKGKTLGNNGDLDSGMVKITDKGDFPFAEMAKSADLKKGQWCMALGHPGGFQTGRSPVLRLGRLIDVRTGFLRTDCTLVGGDSGGPLFDMHGKVIGIHSRIGQDISANIHVPVDTYRETWDRLAKGEAWGRNMFGSNPPSDAYLGVEIDEINKTCKVKGVFPKSPAEKAGLKVDDVILTMDGKKIGSYDDIGSFLRSKRPGLEVSVEVKRGEETLKIKIVLGKRQAG